MTDGEGRFPRFCQRETVVLHDSSAEVQVLTGIISSNGFVESVRRVVITNRGPETSTKKVRHNTGHRKILFVA